MSQAGRSDETPASQRESRTGAQGWTKGHWGVLAACVAAGLALRVFFVALAPQHAFLIDHTQYMLWSAWAAEHGATSVYDLPPGHLINVRFPARAGRGPVTEPYPAIDVCNYPPFAGYIFWIQGWLWRALDANVVTRPVGPELASYREFAGRTATSRVANTVQARAANAAVPIAADLLTAWGALELVRVLGAGRRRGWPEVCAFGIALLAPPMFLNSAFWTQLDSCVACGLVWCMYLLISGRFVWAGLCYGAALTTKAQAVLLLPAVAFALVALWRARGVAPRRRFGFWKFAVASFVTVAVIVAPYAVAQRNDPGGGAWRWFRLAYVVPIRELGAYTTLKAFNLWWIDYSVHNQSPAALNPDAVVGMGLSKARVGQITLAAALLLSAGLCVWRWRWEPPAWVAYAALSLMAAFVFPTRVHERYIYYGLPFLVVVAVGFRPWIPVLAALLLVGTFEMTWFLWLAPADAAPDEGAQSAGAAVWSLLLAAVTVASFVYACAALLRRPGPARSRNPNAGLKIM